jgi:GNAT superfamily N-acetyltransferase
MNPAVRILPLTNLPAGIEALRAESVEEGFRLVDRLITEWHARTNRFDRPGEVFLGAYLGDDRVGVGGLYRDPYTEQERVGRLRHLYVTRRARRHGVASTMVRQLLDRAEGVFDVVRLTTQTEEAAAFYARSGFAAIRDGTASHIIVLQQL